MCCRTARCWRMARPRAHTQPARWLRVREAERARDVCSVPAATAARAAAAERAALGACAERSAGSEAGCEARARHDHRDGDPGAQRLLTSAAQHSCSPALLGTARARFAKRLSRWLHFLSQLCLSLAPPSLRLPSLSLALSLFSPVPFACDSQRLSVNVSRSAQDLQRGTSQRSLPEPDVATQVSPSSTVDPATILWVLGRVYGILSLTDGILWPTWGSSGPVGTNRDERAEDPKRAEDPRRAGGSQTDHRPTYTEATVRRPRMP